MYIQINQSKENIDNDINKHIGNQSKADKRWLTWMKIGERTGCHQRHDRSFFFHGKQFPVCARCTGVMCAYIFSLIRYLLVSSKRRSFKYPRSEDKKPHIVALLGCITMLIDWTVQAVHLRESTNKRRLITGFLGGLGLMHFYITIYYRIGRFIRMRFK